ncbi:ABC transporter permease [Adhaeribacter arboris]|uniref:ABC transporter permease n=2 Tax=Adhaeribacter arboris TaxID=2072846 RepID=A0A2T2YNT1_9BACT|nr:ABC transporter permease [Adhaeribacter arboris]
MLTHYFTIAYRHLLRNKATSFLHIAGLSSGMAVAMLIGLWVWNELSFNKHHQNYDRIVQLWQFVAFDAEKSSYNSLPIPLAEELRNNYPDFKLVSVATFNRESILAHGQKQFTKTGMYVEPAFVPIMSVKLLAGAANGLNDVRSIMLSQSLAQTFFGSENPINKVIKIDNKQTLKVTGVYEDFPGNSSFREVLFLAPWQWFVATNSYARNAQKEWDENSFQIFAQLTEQANVEKVSAKIKDIRMKLDNPPPYKPEFFLHPMSKWHLYADFQNGVNTGGLIYFVWLFGIVGVFVLLLACINFMNLSTARSEKRAKEVGIRKAIGSVRRQLIFQFLSESLLTVAISYSISILVVLVALPFFNEVANTNIRILWSNPVFWLSSLVFCLLTGFIAGSYPALYLSSFQPVKVLKGALKVDQSVVAPRKMLVVFQFTVSITLVIGIITVFRQIDYAKDRPTGYSRNGLIEVRINSPELNRQFASIKNDLFQSRAVVAFSESTGSVTDDYGGVTNVDWPGKSPESHPLLMANRITHDYGKTIGWQLMAGRDFSEDFASDSSAIILNESALQLMALKNPIGETIYWNNKKYRIIGIIRDMIKNNPFEPVSPSFFVIDYESANVMNIKLAPQMGTREALRRVEEVYKKYNPAVPFEYKFVNEEYAKKFSHEERIGKLTTFFAILAIFISCLGLFGLASFLAEQRTKEIGIRKILGAPVFHIWRLLSKDFVFLVLIAFFLATPIAYYFLHKWLQNYEYRTQLPWWVFAAVGSGALIITLLTISYQAIKAALANPIKSLRSE